MKNLWVFEQTRLNILNALLGCSDRLCGCDLKEGIGIKKSLLSHHISVLKRRGFVEEVRCGREKQYRLRKDKVSYIKKVLALVN